MIIIPFLQSHNRTIDLTEWLLYFGQTLLDAQENTLKIIEFGIEKAKFFGIKSYYWGAQKLCI